MGTPNPTYAARMRPVRPVARRTRTRRASHALRIVASACSSPMGERKVITALFCDLVGFTAARGTCSIPRTSTGCSRAYHGIARRRDPGVRRAVEKFIGDAVVGLFGVDGRHEDDPERAVTGLPFGSIDGGPARSRLRSSMCASVSTRARRYPAELHLDSGEGFATGDTLNTAARLQSVAPDRRRCRRPSRRIWRPPNTLRVARSRRRRPQGPAPSRCTSTGRFPSPIDRRAERRATPFAAASRELETLIRLFERSRKTPSVEVVTIVGEPGIG